MTKNLYALILLSASVCAGQSNSPCSGSAAQALPSPVGDCAAAQSPVPTTSNDDSAIAMPVHTTLERGYGQKPVGAPDSKSDTKTDDRTMAPSSKPLRPLARSDFEVFAEDATGHSLQVYGRSLFEEVPSTFAPIDHTPVPAEYAIGPGDELLIRAWGKIDIDATVTVDRNGQIYLPKIGSLTVAGLHYNQLDGYLRNAIGTIYKGFELNVTMGQLRSIQIFVLGNARRTGEFTVSSLSTFVDALITSGGPSAAGSMRHIQLRRGGRTIAELDVYDLLRNGDKSHDAPLLPGDVIFIPTIGPQVAIVGSVNEPGIFELKSETSVSLALEEAGGLTNLATTERVILETIDDRSKHHVDEFRLNASGLQRILNDGDVLKISPISSEFDNAVTIRGNVASPGRFPWHEGMRVSDLIPSREVLVTNDHWNQQNHLSDERHTDMMTDIVQTNAEIDWDYAAIERLDDRDLSTRLIPFNLGNAIDKPMSSDNQTLKIGDVITVFARKDIPLPLEQHQTFVQIGGEVNAPGVYRVKPGETLRDLVERAGGLTSHSYLYASQLTRASARVIQQQILDIEINRIQKELSANYANKNSVASGGATGNASEDAAKMGMQQTFLAKLADVHATGRVVLGLESNAKTIQDIPDFPLEDGDSFFVPAMLATVNVVGEVYNANTFLYHPQKRLSAYLNDTGGATRIADVKRTFLIRADGTVVSRQTHIGYLSGNFENIVLMPGDSIIVPPKLKAPGGFLESLPAITQIVSQTAMTGAMISLVQ
jgi:polysaccharide export outer membrane protein